LGAAIGFVIPSILVGDNSDKHDVFYLMLVEFIVVGCAAIPAILFYKAKPPIPPSNTADEQRDEFKPAISRCIKSPSFRFLLISFACV
jgi:hypothetical protein